VTHAAFAEHADPILQQPPALVAHLGIDEHRRGRPRWRADAEAGEYVLLADRWQCAMRRLVVFPAYTTVAVFRFVTALPLSVM
jgi:hypothetical protein